MFTGTIQNRIDTIRKGMSAKGLREPEASFTVKSDEDFCIALIWKEGATPSYDRRYHFIRGGSAAVLLDNADKWVADLPTADEAKRNEFLAALGRVIDLGKKNGIEADYLNPLVAQMKKLSENIITNQRAA